MLSEQIRQVVAANPELAAVTPVIEKEILHHDILNVMIKEGALQALTFIEGTSLRLCYNSSRLSEDLDFNGGHNFKPSDLHGLESEIQNYLQKKYEIEVWVNKPNEQSQGNTSSWKISIEKEANRPDLPRQKMHIDVCAIPSFDIEKSALINHYNVVVPTEGLLIPVQSLKEIYVDKVIALAYRSRRIKPRDVWDILWLKQKGILHSPELLSKKLEARGKNHSEFLAQLELQVDKIIRSDDVHRDFNSEMSRFIPKKLSERTVENPEYWAYVQAEIKNVAENLKRLNRPRHPFDMGS